jgi:putative oxidoreductase
VGTTGSALRAAGRVSLAWMFIHASSAIYRDPTRAAGTAKSFLGKVRGASPVPLPDDRELVRFNAAVQVVTGTMIAANVATRWAAIGLIASMVPTTLAGHPYWELENPVERRTHQLQFNKNLAMIGGLLLLAAQGASDHAPG